MHDSASPLAKQAVPGRQDILNPDRPDMPTPKRARHAGPFPSLIAVWTAAALALAHGPMAEAAELRSFTVEAETAPSAPPKVALDGALPQSDPAAIPFRLGDSVIEIESPANLPDGPVWVRTRVRAAESGQNARIRISTGETKSRREATVHSDRFTWFRAAALSDGFSRLKVRLEFIEGAPVYLDQVIFEEAPGAVFLPASRPAPRPSQVTMLAPDSDALRSEAQAMRARLGAMGISVAAVLDPESIIEPVPGTAYVLLCQAWDDPPAHRLLPNWSGQPGSQKALWALKPYGVFGPWTAMGLRPGGTAELSDEDLQSLIAPQTGSHVSGEIQPPPPGSLSGRSSDSVGADLASADRQTAFSAASILWEILDSPSELGAIPDSAYDSLASAIGVWVYRAGQWNLTDGERMLYGQLLVRLVGIAEQRLNASAAVSPNPTAGGVSELIDPALASYAWALYWAGRGYGAEPNPLAEGWRQTGERWLAELPKRGLAETMRGRISLARIAWGALSQIGDPPRQTFSALETLVAGQGALCAFGDEPPRIEPGELQSLAPPPPLRAALERPPSPRSSLHRADPPAAASAIAGAAAPSGSFDKIALRTASGAYAIVDGISGGPGGYEDAGAILRYGDQSRVWLAGPGPRAPGAKSQNGITLSVNSEPVRFSPFAKSEADLSGASLALAVFSLESTQGSRWRRAIFSFSQPDALAVLDSVSARKSGRVEVASRFRLLGKPERLSGDRVRLAQPGAELNVWQFGAGAKRFDQASAAESAPWRDVLGPDSGVWIFRERWAGQAGLDDEILLRTVLAREGGSEGGPESHDHPSAAPEGLTAPGVRLGPGAAAFLGPASASGLEFQGLAASFSGDEILLAGMQLLECGQNTIRANPAVDLVIDRAGFATVSTRRSAQISFSLPPGVAIEGLAAGAAAGAQAIVLSPGTRRFTLNPSQGFQPLFDAAAQAIAAFEPGVAGALEPPVEMPEQKGFRLFSQTIDAAGELISLQTFSAPKTEGQTPGEARVIFTTRDGSIQYVDGAKASLFSRLDSPASHAIGVDLDVDGTLEWVAVCADFTLRVMTGAGRELGRVAFGAPPSGPEDPADAAALESLGPPLAFDLEGDGLPDLAIPVPDGLKIFDYLGREKTQFAHAGAPSALAIGDIEGDGRQEILFGSRSGEQILIRFSSDGQAHGEILSQAGAPVVSAAFADLDRSGANEIIYGSDDGGIQAFALTGGAGSTPTPLFEKRLGDDAIVAIAPASANAAVAVVIASRSGFLAGLDAQGATKWIRYLDGGVVAFAPSIDKAGRQEWLAVTDADSLYAIDFRGSIKAWQPLAAPVRFIQPLDRRIFLAGQRSIHIADRIE